MGAGDVFPAEMPDHPSHPMVPLDDDTAERLLAGRLDPEDAPLGYAEVAGLLQTVAGPPSPDELSGLEAAWPCSGPPAAVPPRCGPEWWPWRWPGRWPLAGSG